MLPNEEFALACLAYYEEQGLIVDKTNGEFAHCPLPKGMGETGYYLLHEHHQQQGLLQSRDVGRRCFFTPHTKKWLETVDYFPANYFELWDIYEEFASTTTQLHTPEAVRKQLETRKRNGTLGMEHCHTPEARKRQLESLRRNNSFGDAKQMHTPEVRKKRAKAKQKTIQVTFPDGRVGIYPSLTFASLSLGVSVTGIHDWTKKQDTVSWGRNKGYSARYLGGI